MAIKSEWKKHRVTIDLPADLITWLDARANKEYCSRTALIRRILVNAMNGGERGQRE